MKILHPGFGLMGEAKGNVSQVRRNIVTVVSPVLVHQHNDWHVTINLGPNVLLVKGKETVRLSPGECVEVEAYDEHSLEAYGGDTEYCCIGPKNF